MKDFIEEFGIVCDNPDCDFEVIIEPGKETSAMEYYVNEGCPKCGYVLITPEDYEEYFAMLELFKKIKEEEQRLIAEGKEFNKEDYGIITVKTDGKGNSSYNIKNK